MTKKKLGVDVNHPQRLLEIMAGDVGELFELLIGPGELVILAAKLFFGVPALSYIDRLIIGILNNGLFLLDVSPFWQQVIKGLVILAANNASY